MGEGDMAILGQDVVLREKDALKDLLRLLPRKAQLGFSGLREKWSNRGDKGLMKIISAAKTNDSLKVEYTCMDVNSEAITIGCNLGIVFMYSRDDKTLSRFICESKQVPIVSIKLLKHPNFIATGQFSGAVTIFQYGKEEKSGLMKVLLKCTVESHHEAPVTSIQWTHDGTKLFTADSAGNVAITVINMDEGKTHTVFICREDSPVTQLSFSHTALLISTLQRTLIWPFNTKKVVQVGKQSRKVFGNFGACFFPPAGPLPSDDDVVDIYAARPGLRLWKATMDGKVLTTMIFKDSVNKGEPIIETLELPPHTQLPHQSEMKQFGTLVPFDNQFLVSWQGSSVWVMDPDTGYIIGCHSNLGYVTDVSACNNELYVLSKGDQNFIRKIVFETRIPCIVVEELDLNGPLEEENEDDEEEERQSVFQFNEDQDKLDKLIDEVGSKMIGAICDVKSKVLEFKPFLSGEGYSTSEGLSDVDNLRHDDVTSDENNVDNVNKPFESSNELPKSCEKSPELTQKEKPFDHLSHEAFPKNIVFEGTSVGKSPKRRKKNKIIKKGIMAKDSIEEESNSIPNERTGKITNGLDLDLLNNIDFNCQANEDNVNLFTNVTSPNVNKELFSIEFNELDDLKLNGHTLENTNCEIQMECLNGDVNGDNLIIDENVSDSNYGLKTSTCENDDYLDDMNGDVSPNEDTDTLKEFPIEDITEYTHAIDTQADLYLYTQNAINKEGYMNTLDTVNIDIDKENDNTNEIIYTNTNNNEDKDTLLDVSEKDNVHDVTTLISTNSVTDEVTIDSEPEFYFTMGDDDSSNLSNGAIHKTLVESEKRENHLPPIDHGIAGNHQSLIGNGTELDKSVIETELDKSVIETELDKSVIENEILLDIDPSPHIEHETSNQLLTSPSPSNGVVPIATKNETNEGDNCNDLLTVECSCPTNVIANDRSDTHKGNKSKKSKSHHTLNKPKKNNINNDEVSITSHEQPSFVPLTNKVKDSDLITDKCETIGVGSAVKVKDRKSKSLDTNKSTDSNSKSVDKLKVTDNNSKKIDYSKATDVNCKHIDNSVSDDNLKSLEDTHVNDGNAKCCDVAIEKENNLLIEQRTTNSIEKDSNHLIEHNVPVISNPKPTHQRQGSNALSLSSSEQENRGLLQQNASPSHVVNVKISHQRQGSNVSVASQSERCKEIRGEAIETRNVSPPHGSLHLGEDDTLEANIHRHVEEHLSIDCNLEDSVEEGGKLYPMSPFPAPQMQSIYSQHSVNLSDFSLNHFMEDVDESGQNDDMMVGLTSDYDRIDVHDDLIESLDSITDVEDNLSHSPPEYISGSELKYSGKSPSMVKKRRLKNKHSSFPNSPCSSDVEGRPSVPADILQERLRVLADSWAGIELPTCGQIQFVACSNCLLWVIDNHDHIFYASSYNQYYNWKKLDGKAMLLASNQAGTVVWCIDRQKRAYYRTGVRENSPTGSGWEEFGRNMHYVAVDRDRVWAIKTNGDVFVRTGVSMQKPSGTATITVKIASDLVQVTCLNGLVWALDIYNHVQIFTGDFNCFDSSPDPVSQWCELPGITASHVCLGSKSVCWLIDREYGVWFNQDIATDDDPLGGTWYQLSLGDGQSPDAAWFSSILNYFTAGNEPKSIVANENTGVLILGKQGSLNVAHGHLLGTRWDTKVPLQLSASSWWSCVSAAGSDMSRGYVWALQPSGELFCFKAGGQSYKVSPPNRVVLKYCSAGPRSLWALTAGQDVYIRLGISDTCPQGLKWFKVDMVTQENGRLMSISCGNQVVWAVDYYGNAWFQMGREDRRAGLAPAWVSVEGCPLDGSKFTKIAVGPDDRIVWACDDKNNVYARKNITDNFWVGTNWEVVSGTSGKDVTISSNHVWALCPNGDVLCRFGVSSSNVLGNYWKKVPGSFEQISVSPNDEIWGIDRQGHLYQRQSLLFYGSTLSNRAPSYNDLFSDHNDWEFI